MIKHRPVRSTRERNSRLPITDNSTSSSRILTRSTDAQQCKKRSRTPPSSCTFGRMHSRKSGTRLGGGKRPQHAATAQTAGHHAATDVSQTAAPRGRNSLSPARAGVHAAAPLIASSHRPASPFVGACRSKMSSAVPLSPPPPAPSNSQHPKSLAHERRLVERY